MTKWNVHNSALAKRIFDCNVSLGRRHNERTPCDSKEAILDYMELAGISRALIYHSHCIHWGTMDGNRLLLDSIGTEPSLVPQFVISLAVDSIDDFQDLARRAYLKSIRIFPNTHRYPFVHWVADQWMEWAALNGISLWIPMGHVPEADVRDIYEMAGRHPSVPLVLAGSHYVNYSSVLPLLRARDNIYVDLSRFDIADGVVRLVNLIGAQRLLFGSSLPDVDPIPYIYYLGQCGLRQPDLEDICHCNLERLLGHENY